MSQSTDAILAFGFDLGETDLEEILNDSPPDGGDFEDWLCHRAGVIYPAGHDGIDSDEYKAYDAAKKAAIEACPVELLMHCSYECPMYYLALRGSSVKANRGYPQDVYTNTPQPEKIAAMKAFCDELGIDWQQPKWHIFSMWG